MSLIPSIAIFFVIWWLCLFVVLPFGVKSQHEAGEITPGSESGAPHRPHLLVRAAATTGLAVVIFAGFYVYFDVYHKTLEDLLP